jgi:hypothetical protein
MYLKQISTRGEGADVVDTLCYVNKFQPKVVLGFEL